MMMFTIFTVSFKFHIKNDVIGELKDRSRGVGERETTFLIPQDLTQLSSKGTGVTKVIHLILAFYKIFIRPVAIGRIVFCKLRNIDRKEIDLFRSKLNCSSTQRPKVTIYPIWPKYSLQNPEFYLCDLFIHVKLYLTTLGSSMNDNNH